MHPLDLIPWALCGSLAILILSIGVAFGGLVIRSFAGGSKNRGPRAVK